MQWMTTMLFPWTKPPNPSQHLSVSGTSTAALGYYKVILQPAMPRHRAVSIQMKSGDITGMIFMIYKGILNDFILVYSVTNFIEK